MRTRRIQLEDATKEELLVAIKQVCGSRWFPVSEIERQVFDIRERALLKEMKYCSDQMQGKTGLQFHGWSTRFDAANKKLEALQGR